MSIQADFNPGFAIANVKLFDGKQTIPNCTVVVEKGSVASVANDAPYSAARETINGSGRTLLPGLIDAHTHAWDPLRMVLGKALQFGVTTELDMFAPASIFAFKNEQAQGQHADTRRRVLSRNRRHRPGRTWY